MPKLLNRLNYFIVAVLAIAIVGVVGVIGYVGAADISEFRQVISAGTLAVTIVDGSYATVTNPAVHLSTTTFSFACSTSTGIFGATTTEQIYVSNPDGADGGWTLTIAASSTDALWDSAGTDFDYNEPGGCADNGGGDSDSFGGQMTINPAGATLSAGACSACDTGDISKGSSASFTQDSVSSITLLTAAAESDDIGDWRLNGVAITQTIPAEQPAASDYSLSMTVDATAT